MKKIIHVNKQKIASNNKHKKNDPVITCKTYKNNTYGHEATIYGQDGKIAAKVIHNQNKPLSCGAKVWIETSNEVKII